MVNKLALFSYVRISMTFIIFSTLRSFKKMVFNIDAPVLAQHSLLSYIEIIFSIFIHITCVHAMTTTMYSNFVVDKMMLSYSFECQLTSFSTSSNVLIDIKFLSSTFPAQSPSTCVVSSILPLLSYHNTFDIS